MFHLALHKLTDNFSFDKPSTWTLTGLKHYPMGETFGLHRTAVGKLRAGGLTVVTHFSEIFSSR